MIEMPTFKELTDGLFRKILGMTLVVGGGCFLWKVAFLPDSQWTGEIVGFVMGTAISIVLNFFFGTSQGSVDKSKQLTEIIEDETE